MPHDEQGHEYHMVSEMIDLMEYWIDNQVPGILPWHLLAAQCRWESSFNPFAVSPAGAKGIAQFMDETWAEIGHGDPFNVKDAVEAQSKYMLYLAMLHAETSKTTPWWWVASYTWGFGRVQRVQGFIELPSKVLAHAWKVVETSEYYWKLFNYTPELDR